MSIVALAAVAICAAALGHAGLRLRRAPTRASRAIFVAVAAVFVIQSAIAAAAAGTGGVVLFGHPAEFSGVLLGMVLLALGGTAPRGGDDGATLIGALRDRSRKLPQVLDALPCQVAFLDTDLRCQFVNSAFTTFFGVPAGHLIGKRSPEILGEHNFRRVRAFIDRALSGVPTSFKIALDLPGRGERHLDIEYVPVHRAGRVEGVLVLVWDLTQEHRESELAEERQSKLALSAEVLGIGYLVWDRTLTLVSASDSAIAIIDRTIEEGHAEWNDDHDFVAAPDRERVERALRDARRSSSPVQVGATMRTRAGEQRVVRLSLRRLPDHRPVQIVGAIQDITTEARALARLGEETARFRELTEAVSDWIWETDARDRFTFVSRGAQVIAGIDPETLIGHTRANLQPIVEEGQWAELEAAVGRREAFRNLRYGVRRPDGRIGHFEISGKPVRDAGGRFVGYRGVGSDVTRVVEAERARSTVRDALSTAIDSVAAMFALFDPDDRVLLCNRKYAELFSVTEQDLSEGATFETILRRNAAAGAVAGEAKAVADWLRTRLARRVSPANAFLYRLAQGTWIEVSDYLLADGSILTIALDVSDRVAAESAVRRHELTLQKLHRRGTLGQMVAAIAHELNQPLAAIANYAGGAQRLAEQGELSSDRILTALRRLQEQSDRAASVLRSIRDHYTQADTLLEPVTAGDLLAPVRALTLSEANARKVVLEFEDASRGARTLCARTEIEQAAVNLVRNAIEAASDRPEGSRHVGVRLDADAEWVSLNVSDTGSGIPEERLEDLFEPFTSSRDGGLGLGLAICRSVAENHDGTISYGTAPDGQTRFTLRLPRLSEDHAGAAGSHRLRG